MLLLTLLRNAPSLTSPSKYLLAGTPAVLTRFGKSGGSIQKPQVAAHGLNSLSQPGQVARAGQRSDWYAQGHLAAAPELAC